MDGKVTIIAEVGKNFVITEEEDPLPVLLERAKTLIKEAKTSGADIVKFQCHNYEDEVHPEAHLISPHFDHDRYEWVKRNTYPVGFWMALSDYCREIRIEFLATPMSWGAAILLDVVGVDRWKIGSGDILDFVMLDYIRDSGKPVILSSGMSTLEELKLAYNYLAEKIQDITIMHCVSMYPCPLEKLNLSTIPFLKKEFPKAKIGFSSHCLDITGSLMAVSLGAEVIEQHFSLNRNAWGSDHKSSLLPEEFKDLAFYIKNPSPIKVKNDKALGVETKYLRPEEGEFRPIFRKGLYFGEDIKAGQMISREDIISLRPKLDGALPSQDYPKILGTYADRDYKKYDLIKG